MPPIVSNARRRKTRFRERQAERAAARRLPLRQRHTQTYLVALILWAIVLALFGLQPQRLRGAEDWFFQVLGQGTFLAIGLFIACLALQLAVPDMLARNRTVLLMAVISLVSLASIRAVSSTVRATHLLEPQIAQFLHPLAMAPLLGTILIGGTAGIALGFWVSFAVAIFTPDSFSIFCSGMMVSVVCAVAAQNVRTRARVLRVGLIAGLSKIPCVLGVTAMNWAIADVSEVLHQAAAGVAAGFASAIVVLLILPLFEWAFRVTTDITLLELSDLGHPLLQRLAIEAPGTYHHCLVVANLAQAAADEIGANSLLTRVCSYFHDIGKLIKPKFFSENIQMQPNPHDDLPPSMSTLVITSHVKEGLSLALLHKLPEPIKQVILEHHGTSVLAYFHHKASRQIEEEQEIGQTGTGLEEGAFRYAGPKPSSRESAIIHLADSVEAASRSMEKTTPGHIEGLVHDIIEARIHDGQLDDSNLKIGELVKIKNSFVSTLTNMLHGRVAYPKDETRNRQQARRPQGGPGPAKTAGNGSAGSPGETVPPGGLAGDIDRSDG